MAPARVRAGELATLDGSSSTDPEGGPLTFGWSFGDGGLGDGPTTGHPFAVAGAYRVVLEVTDAAGATATATANVEVVPGSPANESASIAIEAGAPFVARPDVAIDLRGPPGATQVQLANGAGVAGAVTMPLAPRLAWRLDEASGDGPRQVSVRFLDSGGHHLPGFDRTDGVGLDRAPPVLGRARTRPSAPVLVCAPGGRAVAGTSRRSVPVTVRAAARDGLSGLRRVEARSGSSGPVPVGSPAWALRAPPGGTVEVRAVDRAGNVSPWRATRVPEVAIEVIEPSARPFTRARACGEDGQAAAIRRVGALWRAAGAPGGDRAWIRPTGSALTWTVYSGQGLFPNWVHAGTELNDRYRHGSIAGYRAAVSEIVAMSTLDHAGARRFRVNENLFAVPEDGHPPPWRDAMGTGVILALIVPALPPGADEYELDTARHVAEQYLATFFVDRRDGGVVLDTTGPAAWYLEYAYRSRDRVLNGFLQSVLSLSRFARQADRFSRRHPQWGVLRDRAEERVTAGARAAYDGLPAYDLGGGASRYQLGSGPASPRYRAYHQTLLGELARIPYLPAAWRERFAFYRLRWGGSAVPSSRGPTVAGR